MPGPPHLCGGKERSSAPQKSGGSAFLPQCLPRSSIRGSRQIKTVDGPMGCAPIDFELAGSGVTSLQCKDDYDPSRPMRAHDDNLLNIRRTA
jgi:hypothetical protein